MAWSGGASPSVPGPRRRPRPRRHRSAWARGCSPRARWRSCSLSARARGFARAAKRFTMPFVVPVREQKAVVRMGVSSRAALGLVAALCAAVGCGSVTPAGSPDGGAGGSQMQDAPSAEAPPPADAPAAETPPSENRIVEACAAVAKAACDKRVSCSGDVNAAGVGVLRAFGTMAECLVRQALLCTSAFRAPGSGHSLATEQECVAACAFAAQCKSGFCTGEKNALCGTCAPAPAVGASCAASDCGRGQICDATTATCKAPGVAGDACDSGDDCGYALVCGGVAGTAGGARTCQTTVAKLGAPCGGTMPVCDGAEGLFCAGAMGAKTCTATTFVGAGMPCGVLSQDALAACTAGLCYAAKGLVGQGETGACKANAAEGVACDTVLGPACEVPARCILSGNGTAGTCRLPNGTCN